MRNFRIFMQICMFSLLSLHIWAQTGSYSGAIISSEDKTPLAGATVLLKGSNKSTRTNAKGEFSIPAKKGDVIIISHVGFSSLQITVGENTSPVSIALERNSAALTDVVVTAMDIKRNARELGYSVQTIQGTELQQTQRENLLSGIQGRVAGATVTQTGGQAGASANIVLRGFNSLALSNQPLFVVDGVIVDNQSINENSDNGSSVGLASDRPNRNNDYTNRIADLNPSDIESYTVLKGPEATALYGSQAASGAIIITTRRAKAGSGLKITYDDNFRFQKMTRFPKTIHTFSPGTNGVATDTTNPSADGFSYFGPAYPAGTKFFDNKKDFFRTGFGQTHNLGLEFGKKDFGFRFSGTFYDQAGVVPTNSFKKSSLRLSNFTKLGKFIEITPAITYVNTRNYKPLRGDGGYLLDLLIWPADHSIKPYVDANGHKIPIYPGDNLNSEPDNPLWNVHYNDSRDVNDRWLATLGINITPFSWLTVAGRFGYDTYHTDGYSFYHPESSTFPSGTHGSLDNYYRRYYGYNHTINATAKKTFGAFSGRLMAGTMWQDYKTEMFSVTGTGIIDNNRRDSGNTDPSTRIRLNRNNVGQPNLNQYRQIAYFGEAGISFKDMIFLDYTHRFESSSSLPSVNRNFNYPSVSLSVIFTDLIPGLKDNHILNYGKLRGSYASTAKSNTPYSNQSVFVNQSSSGGGNAYDFGNNNFYLQPERQRTFEAGTELRFLNSRLSIDADYYNTKNTDQIVENFRSSYATGYVLNTLNVGATRNQGVEIVLDATPVRSQKFSWVVRVNFNKMWNKVLSLPANVPEFYIGDTWLYQNARGGLVKGGSTTSITSWGYARNNAGQVLIDPATGLPVQDQNFKVHGDRNPIFTAGINNTFNYGNWSLTMLWDWKNGGDIFNGTEMFLTLNGISTQTTDRTTARVIPGVLKDGNENSQTPTKNTKSVTPSTMSGDYYGALREEDFIQHKVDWLRMRDLTISYTFPKVKIQGLKVVKSLGIFATGTDLILITNYKGADPSVNGTTPGTPGVGAFGFDYGTIPPPTSFSFGIRAGF